MLYKYSYFLIFWSDKADKYLSCSIFVYLHFSASEQICSTYEDAIYLNKNTRNTAGLVKHYLNMYTYIHMPSLYINPQHVSPTKGIF